MYEAFFGLRREPFSIAPDPAFLYLSERHREALGLLSYGLARGASFVLLSGEIGAGKTTVWRRFLEELPSNVDVANVVNPKLGVDALLRRVFEDLQLELPAGGAGVDMIDALHGQLLLAGARGRRMLIVIDEAQALAPEVLEQLRLLTNLDVSGKLLQVMLIAQPEMLRLLERPELEPLAQRIVARHHLAALTEPETAAYIAHRLRVAGLEGELPFDGEALALVHRTTRGTPRRINALCDRALAIAAQRGTRRIDREIVARAAAQALGGPAAAVTTDSARGPVAEPGPLHGPRALALAAGAALVVAAGGWLLLPPLAGRSDRAAPPAAASARAASAASAPSPAAQAEPAPAPAERATFPTTPRADEALAELARLWGANGVATGAANDVCTALPRQGLACYTARGGLTTLRQLDRPAVLHLADAQGRPAHALLVALRDDTATLAAAGVRRELPVAALAPAWRGEFTTLWRTPPGWRGPGEVDAGWLKAQLARAGSPAAATPQQRLLGFQAAQGLTPDGIAGPLTLMRLNRGPDEPRL